MAVFIGAGFTGAPISVTICGAKKEVAAEVWGNMGFRHRLCRYVLAPERDELDDEHHPRSHLGGRLQHGAVDLVVN